MIATRPLALSLTLVFILPGMSLAEPQEPAVVSQAVAEQPAAQLAAPVEHPQTLGTIFKNLWADVRHLPSRKALLLGAVGGGLAIGVHPFDDDVNQKLAKDSGLFSIGHGLGNAVTIFGGALATYGVGRAIGKEKVAHVGLDLLRSEILTAAMVQTIKRSVRRERPDGSGGFAFPSGHAAMTFAAAAVLDRHHSWRFAIPAYTLATYVATSRLRDNRHYLSDVVFGAAVGTIIGRTVTRHAATGFAVVPQVSSSGAAVFFVRTPRA